MARLMMARLTAGLAGLSGVLVFVSACGSADVQQPAPPPVDPRVYQTTGAQPHQVRKSPFEKERELLQTFGQAFAQGDVKAMTPLIDPDADLYFPGMADASDRDGLLKSMGDLFGAFTDRKYAVSRIWQSGAAAVVEWAMTATQSGEFMGVKPTNKQVGIKGITLYWFNMSGLINEMHVTYDVGAVLAQLGAPVKGTVAEALPMPQLAATPEVFVAAGTEDEQKEVRTLNQSFDAFEAKNEAGYLLPYADDVQVFRLDRAAPEQGKAERAKFAKSIARGVTSMAQNPLNAWGVGPYVIEEYSITGVNSGPLAGAQASGHAIQLHMVDIAQMQGDKIVKMWTYANSLEPLFQMKVIQKGAP